MSVNLDINDSDDESIQIGKVKVRCSSRYSSKCKKRKYVVHDYTDNVAPDQLELLDNLTRFHDVS